MFSAGSPFLPPPRLRQRRRGSRGPTVAGGSRSHGAAAAALLEPCSGLIAGAAPLVLRARNLGWSLGGGGCVIAEVYHVAEASHIAEVSGLKF